MLSARFSQLPERGVYNGRMPCSNSHSTNSGVLWPALGTDDLGGGRGLGAAPRGEGLLLVGRERTQRIELAAGQRTPPVVGTH